MSSIERFSRTIPASGVIETPRGNVFLLIAATGTINVRFENGGAAEGVNGVNGGVRVERVKPWDAARILGTAGVTVDFWVGSQIIERDLIDVFTQIATIAGVAAVRQQPFTSVTDTPLVTIAASGNAVVFAANALRQKVRIMVDPNNPDIATIRTLGPGANIIGYLQPGAVYDFPGIYGLHAFCPATAGNYNFAIFEEN